MADSTSLCQVKRGAGATLQTSVMDPRRATFLENKIKLVTYYGNFPLFF